MKKIIKASFLFLLASAFINPIKAQDAKTELTAFVKKFEEAYNKKNDKALKGMYTKDATRTMVDGKVQNGNEEIRVAFADYLKNNKVTIEIKLDAVTTDKDGNTTTTGSFHVTGTTEKGEKIDRIGIYTNTVVKEGENWKISKSVITAP